MPTHSAALTYRGRCLRYLERHDEAARAFRAALECNPRATQAYIFLSNLLAEDGKKAEAVKVLEEAKLALPDNMEVRRALQRLNAKPSSEPTAR
jgi:tetratricopeptide (TPR) repeat protein